MEECNLILAVSYWAYPSTPNGDQKEGFVKSNIKIKGANYSDLPFLCPQSHFNPSHSIPSSLSHGQTTTVNCVLYQLSNILLMCVCPPSLYEMRVWYYRPHMQQCIYIFITLSYTTANRVRKSVVTPMHVAMTTTTTEDTGHRTYDHKSSDRQTGGRWCVWAGCGHSL